MQSPELKAPGPSARGTGTPASTHPPASRPGAPAGPIHIRALDGIRGLSISLVLLYHGWTFAGTGAGYAVSRICVIGWAGVDVFFVLSGFLITGILVETKGEPRYWRNFLIRRGLRIFPLYYAVLILLVAVGVSGALGGNLVSGLEHMWVNFLYLTNFAVATWGEDHVPLDSAWSLAIEEQFYIFYPAIVLLCSRRNLERALVMMIVAAPVLRILTFYYGQQPVLGPYVLPYCRMDALAIGALVRLAYNRNHSILPALARLAPILCIAAVTVLIVWTRKELRFVAIGYSLSAVAAAALLVRVLHGGERSLLRRVFENPTLVHIGKVSYGVYLFHLIARAVVAKLLARVFPADQIGSELYYAVQLAGMSLLAIGAATASYYAFERPILRLKDRWAPTRATR